MKDYTLGLLIYPHSRILRVNHASQVILSARTEEIFWRLIRITTTKQSLFSLEIVPGLDRRLKRILIWEVLNIS
jgi:hypothetical protein